MLSRRNNSNNNKNLRDRMGEELNERGIKEDISFMIRIGSIIRMRRKDLHSTDF